MVYTEEGLKSNLYNNNNSNDDDDVIIVLFSLFPKIFYNFVMLQAV